MPIIKMHHIRKAGFCSEGLRQFAIANNLDWNKFLKEGISSDAVKNVDDAQIKRVLNIVEKEQNGLR